MRKIDWEGPLSDEDIAWLRQTGMPGVEERIARHQEQFGGTVPEVDVDEDSVVQSALDPAGRAKGDPVPSDGAPINTTPEPGSIQAGDALVEESEMDDYDKWKVSELENEVVARNEMADTSEVVIEGTGANNKVTKGDLIKALRLWDQENPEALKD